MVAPVRTCPGLLRRFHWPNRHQICQIRLSLPPAETSLQPHPPDLHPISHSDHCLLLVSDPPEPRSAHRRLAPTRHRPSLHQSTPATTAAAAAISLAVPAA
ncbi:hypothetical protein Syun_029963 [Stephania yunnanensis]|uniref:Uncharacterized protein n=1 Tax=Stephania yunnanensis TaxID=152371 RepID=A0AAP0HHR9_9MAGN